MIMAEKSENHGNKQKNKQFNAHRVEKIHAKLVFLSSVCNKSHQSIENNNHADGNSEL